MVRFADLTPAEAAAFGPLLHMLTATLGELLSPDQTYICHWAHAGWTPGHIHFVIQPSWDRLGRTHARPGPFLQVEMFEAAAEVPVEGVEAFCVLARETIAHLSGSALTNA